MTNRTVLFAAALSAFALTTLTHRLAAQQIATRAALNGVLTSSTTEGFETFVIVPGTAAFVPGPLDNGTVVIAQSHLVVPGIRFFGGTGQLPAGSLQVNGVNYLSMTSQSLVANNPLRIDFLGFTQAFGLDLISFPHLPGTGTVSVYGPGGIFLQAVTLGVAEAPSSTFFGFRNDAGITSISILDSQHNFSPNIDNLTFGVTAAVATPEPATLTLLATGLVGVIAAARRKRIAPSMD